MVTFLIVFASLVGVNILLLLFSNSLVFEKGLFKKPAKKTHTAPSQVYSLSSSDSEYRNAV